MTELNERTPEQKLAARRAGTRSAQVQTPETFEDEAPHTTRAPRRPQDHKAKKSKPATTIEYEGVIYDVNPDILDDWEIIEEAQSLGDAGNMFLIKKFLGESYDLAKEELRDPETGRIHKQDMADFLAFVSQEIANLS